MIELKKSEVLYDDANHQYFYKGRELKGITKMLKKRCFPNMYSHVSEETLNAAAQRGTLIHEQVELVASLDIDPSLECVKAFKKFIKDNGYEIVGCEYVIRIGDDHASAIDLVMRKVGGPEEEVEIWDVKSTYSVVKEYVRWQNSIYKYGFEKLNENLKVTRICCMWLRDDNKRGTICRLIELGEPRPSSDVEKLLLCDKEDTLFEDDENTPYYIINNEVALMDVQERIKNLEKVEQELKATILEGMTKHNVASFKSANFTYSLKEGSERVSLDKDNFNEDDKKIFDALLNRNKKVSITKPSLAMRRIS